ncbi:MAG: hypothetical protein MUC47_07625 [Candidatus Kapabacteria bacterium]|jgi:hypothetical protein|nr:hypothetical protein [Candidatus Kapabacteria bacterium]
MFQRLLHIALFTLLAVSLTGMPMVVRTCCGVILEQEQVEHHEEMACDVSACCEEETTHGLEQDACCGEAVVIEAPSQDMLSPGGVVDLLPEATEANIPDQTRLTDGRVRLLAVITERNAGPIRGAPPLSFLGVLLI